MGSGWRWNTGKNEGGDWKIAFSVRHYIAKQQVAIAEETAKRKTAELAVTNAAAKRDVIRREARTAQADAAQQKAAIAQQATDLQATDLAGANTKRDKALIAQQEMQLKALKAKKTERGLMITLGDILFRNNKEYLESGGLRHVKKLADFLKQYSQYKVMVEGHTDSIGSNSANQALSERRANAVKTVLNEMGAAAIVSVRTVMPTRSRLPATTRLPVVK